MKKLLVILLLSIFVFANSFPKHYYDIKDTKKMKSVFFDFIKKLAIEENGNILYDRKFIQTYYLDIKTIKDKTILTQFNQIKKRYELKDNASLQDYLKAIDIIPVSLIMAQSAIESGWGKSRFTKEANNIFGQWTWSGKGLIPKQRDIGKIHRIKIFGSLDAAVRGYMLNLNSNNAYKELRELREKIRKYKAPLSGLAFSKTLINYSAIKEKYTKLLAIMIVKNHLERFDD
jgi:Bax protein